MTYNELGRVVNKLPRPITRLLRLSFIRYVIGGCIAASAHLAVMMALIELVGTNYESANSLGFVVGLMINYGFQRRVTFRNHVRRHAEQLPLFFGFALMGLGINRYLFALCVHDFKLQYIVAASMAILVVFAFNFTANSLVTFKRAKSGTT